MLQLEITTENKELISICQLYWEVDSNLEFIHTVKELAELAKIDKFKLPSAIRDACYAYIADWKCSDCGEPIIFSVRSDLIGNRQYLLDGSYRQRPFLCAKCQKERRDKEIEENKRKDEAARKAREAIEIELRKKIRETYDLSNRQSINVQSLSLTDAVYLISMLRGGGFENLTKIMPVLMFEQPLSADNAFSTEIISHLFNNRLIYVHPDTEPEAFADNDVSKFYIYHAYYAPPINQSTPDEPKTLVTDLLRYINGMWSDEWCQEALSIWKKVALSECKEYLLFILQEHHFEFNPGEKTTQYLEYALENFSTAQVFNTIWRSAKDAAAYYQREDISKRQAANAAISAIQRYSERAIAEGWEMKPYRRNYKCQQAVISEVFYNLVLKLGDDGFQLIPNIETIRMKKLTSSNPNTY